eukprot:g8907.t1
MASEKTQEPLPSALDENTFITALEKEAAKATEDAVNTIYQPQGYGNVQDLHGKVTHIVQNLSDKLGMVLKKQEKDFLSAYRAHMYNVQKELQNLRSKVDEAELAMKKDAKIVGLQKERNWFRKEALRLDGFATNIKKDLKFMREKLVTIEEDRNWLEKQLKASKKQNKLLRAELEIRLSSTPVHTPIDDPRAVSPMFPPTRDSNRRSMTTTPSMGFRNNDNNSRGMKRNASYNPNRKSVGQEKLIKENKDKKEEIRMLKRQLKAAHNEMIKMRAANVGEQQERSALEELFLRCVDTIKKDVERRKANPSTGFKPTQLARKDSHGGQKNGRMSPPVKLSQFTQMDRRRVIEELMSKDEVLAYLYDALFPPTEEELAQDRVGEQNVEDGFASGEEEHSQTYAGHVRIPSALETPSNNNDNDGEQKQATLKLDPQIEEYLRNVKNKTM